MTCLPPQVSQGLRVVGPCFRHRHQLVFSWLLVLHSSEGARANRQALARHGPAHLAYQQSRRLLCAASWCTQTVRWWCADQALQALRPPADGLRSLVGDSTLKGKRGQKPPVAQNTPLSQRHPAVFGFRVVLLMAPGDGDRLPVDFAVLRRKDAPDDQTEDALGRQMLHDFRRPVWCQEVVVTADAAYASQADMVLIQELGYGYVLALPRPWAFADGKALKALVTHLPCGQ